ncbi:GNAT family N-acetyltransferase [Actinoplanes sp. NPDC051851]|uniref:GNAT family N-acetyltransferase n=1 Tax=Actinoplanes sp. NPDC051851 TaxID=3154753 RepID=UPI0034222801
MISLLADDDTALLTAVTEMVNQVYAESEEGLWQAGAARTTVGEVTVLAHLGELVVDMLDGELAGVVRVHQIDAHTGEIAMLAADPRRRGQGIGRDLVRWAESACRARGDRTMRLELLVPREFTLDSKEFLHGWYTRMGYAVQRTGQFEEEYPQLAPMLATPVDYRIYEKPLR